LAKKAKGSQRITTEDCFDAAFGYHQDFLKCHPIV
jgi:hypothetical protein